MRYPVVEHFHSIQGEGRWSGSAAYFIRLAGCDVGCSWCDTKDSWEPKEHPFLSIDCLVDAARQSGARTVVLTGGEPTMHNLTYLTDSLTEANLTLHLETSGTHPISGSFAWITLSPKRFKQPLPQAYALANELKVVVACRKDLMWAEQQRLLCRPAAELYLQPEWTTADARKWIVDYVLRHPEWKVSLQIHKHMGIR